MCAVHPNSSTTVVQQHQPGVRCCCTVYSWWTCQSRTQGKKTHKPENTCRPGVLPMAMCCSHICMVEVATSCVLCREIPGPHAHHTHLDQSAGGLKSRLLPPDLEPSPSCLHHQCCCPVLPYALQHLLPDQPGPYSPLNHCCCSNPPGQVCTRHAYGKKTHSERAGAWLGLSVSHATVCI